MGGFGDEEGGVELFGERVEDMRRGPEGGSGIALRGWIGGLGVARGG